MNTVVWVIMVTIFGTYSIPTALEFETKHKCEAAIASIHEQEKLQWLTDRFMSNSVNILPHAWCAKIKK